MNNNLKGYYRVHLIAEGFKTPFIVYAASSAHAIDKAIDDAGADLPNPEVCEIEGPYYNALFL